MSTLKKLINSVKIFALCAVLTLGLFAPSAMADTGSKINLIKQLTVKGENFHYEKTNNNVPQGRIDSALVSLNPSNVTATIDAIVITGPNRKREFACAGLKIQNGTDLIKSCGGPAILESGETTYMAIGSGFPANSDTILSIDLNVAS